MNDFIFYSPTRFVFGRGYVDRTGEEIAAFNAKHVLLIYGGSSVKRTGVLDRVEQSLAAHGVEFIECGGVRPNPEVTFVRNAIATVKSEIVCKLPHKQTPLRAVIRRCVRAISSRSPFLLS
ncbi:MAG: iron-containing alcohol dehydrogenase [Coriobacteriaceae bacterium]|nr:MAG: iron-containing alcohol dehydrogenase [Coriobacteriaceae bacterium]